MPLTTITLPQSGFLKNLKTNFARAKYFPRGLGDSQKGQIEDSFNQITSKSEEKGFRIKAWHLCVPCAFSGPERIWWERWVKDKNRATGLAIKLMSSLDIITMLQTTDALAICSEFNLTDSTLSSARQTHVLPCPSIPFLF